MNEAGLSPTPGTGQIVRGIIMVILGILVTCWVFYRAFKRSEEPKQLLVKWLLTIPILWYIFYRIMPRGAEGGMVAIGAVLTGMLLGLALAIIWRQSIASMFAKPFTDLYDGGDLEAKPRPFYSVAMAKRKRGRYDEAIALIREQLVKFRDDFDGQLMIAEIQAENLNDVPGAQVTIHRLCQQSGHAPRSVAFALNSLADWQLKFCQDRDAARQALQKIIELLPDSEMSALAAQRIAHLADTGHLVAYHDRQRIVVKAGVQDFGLVPHEQQPKAPETDPSKQAMAYIKHLELHPLDTEVREKLAVLYADHYQRLDLAADQMEQLISAAGQPAKRVVHWVNVLADLQVRHGADYDTVRKTVQRIIDLFPDAHSAETARNRIAHLRLELKGQESGSTVKLGTYEQDIGLKRGLPNKL